MVQDCAFELRPARLLPLAGFLWGFHTADAIGQPWRKSELTLPNSSVHYFNFNPSLWLADGFRSLSAKLKHGDLSQATVIGVFAPELATIGKDMVVYALDGRKGDGAILSKDKAVRGRGVEPTGLWFSIG